jgi:signal transduction histidine kinase
MIKSEVGRRTAGERELTHERALAERFALLKLILAVTNFLVLLLDRPNTDTVFHIKTPISFVATSFFLLYMIGNYEGLRRRWISLRTFQSVVPFLDVIAATALILCTEGYLSQFQVWMTLSVVAAGFGSEIKIPFMVGGLAIVGQLIIAIVPQAQPLDFSVFVVRTLYILGFAFIIAAASSQLVKQSKTLADIDELGHDLYGTAETDEAIRLFVNSLSAYLGSAVITVQALEAEFEQSGYPIIFGSGEDLICLISRAKPLSSSDDQFVRLAVDRLTSTLKRISLSKDLVEAAAREERQRYADELHDTHLQTLAVVDMRLKVAERARTTEASHRELFEIKSLVREAAAKTRAFIRTVEEQPPSGPESIRQVFAERWPDSTVMIEDKLDLTEGQWRVVQMLIQEGINNARRHGNAKKGSFHMARTPTGVEGALTANGHSPKPGFRYGYGLKRLDTVARANAGEISLIGNPEGGSKLSVLFRFEEPSN